MLRARPAKGSAGDEVAAAARGLNGKDWADGFAGEEDRRPGCWQGKDGAAGIEVHGSEKTGGDQRWSEILKPGELQVLGELQPWGRGAAMMVVSCHGSDVIEHGLKGWAL